MFGSAQEKTLKVVCGPGFWILEMAICFKHDTIS